jgi:hypothetical protein
MKKQYLHLSVYGCEACKGPVVSGSLAVRENEISRETEQQEVGAICLSCGHRPGKLRALVHVRDFPPTEWEAPSKSDAGNFKKAFVGMP